MTDTSVLATESGLGANVVPSQGFGSSPLASQSALAQKGPGYIQKIEEASADQAKTFEAEQAALDPYRKRLLSILESPNAAHAHLEKIKEQPKPEDYQKYSMEFASAMTLLGALAGRFTRAGGTGALDAFAGALKGWQQGNLQNYEMHVKEWEQATRRTIENNEMELQKYREIMNDKKLNIDQMMAAMNVVSTQFQNKIMFDATQAQNYQMAFQMTDKLDVAQGRLQASYDWLHGTAQQQRQEFAAQIKELNDHPEIAQRLMQEKPEQWLKYKGAAEQMGMTLNDPAAGTEALPKVGTGGQPRSAPAMAVAQFKSEFKQKNGREPSAEEITAFAAKYAGDVSYQRSAGTYASRVENATNEVAQLLPQALETSRALPRGQWVPFNQIYQAYLQGKSDPAYNDFIAANFGLINAYTRAMNPTGNPRIAERNEQHAIGLLSTATSQQAYEVQAQRLWKEVQASKTAVSETQAGRSPGDINAPMPGGSPTATVGGAPAINGTTSSGIQWKLEQ